MAYYCTDFSITQNWAFNERCVTYDFTASINGTVTIGFSRCCWIAPYTSGTWSVLTTFSLVIRNDTGKINSSPCSITSPVLRLGCSFSINDSEFCLLNEFGLFSDPDIYFLVFTWMVEARVEWQVSALVFTSFIVCLEAITFIQLQ